MVWVVTAGGSAGAGAAGGKVLLSGRSPLAERDKVWPSKPLLGRTLGVAAAMVNGTGALGIPARSTTTSAAPRVAFQGIWTRILVDVAENRGTGFPSTKTCMGGSPSLVGSGRTSAGTPSAGPKFWPLISSIAPRPTVARPGVLVMALSTPRGLITGGSCVFAAVANKRKKSGKLIKRNCGSLHGRRQDRPPHKTG